MTRTLRRLLPIVLGALVLAGCSTGGNTPEGYPDRTQPESEQESTNDYEVWLNYESACLEANAGLEEDVAQEICTCTWDAFVEQVPFEVFMDLDDRIRERIGDIGDNRADLEAIAANVVADYNRNRAEDQDPLDVDLIALMEGCQTQAA